MSSARGSESGEELIDALRQADGSLPAAVIPQIIPYREPFLFVTSVFELNRESISAAYFAAEDGWYFKGHFAQFPVMPGALIAEGLGQAASILVRYRLKNPISKHVLVYRVNQLKFGSLVFPNTELEYRIKLNSLGNRLARLEAEASVEGVIAAKCQIIQVIVQRDTVIPARKSFYTKSVSKGGRIENSVIS